MLRLNKQNTNTPEMVDKIFIDRWNSQVHYIDWERFKKLAEKFKGGKYLDVGCFNSPMPGDLTREFPYSEIWALDHAPVTIAAMQSRFPKVKYICHDFLKGLPFVDGYFDYVVAGEVIEHLEEPQKFIDECYRILKPGGILAVTTPFEETISTPPVSNEHLWAYKEEDIKNIMSKFNQVEISIYKDSVSTFLIYGDKGQN